MNEQLKEKIARIIYTVRLNIMHGFYVNDMEIAQQILDLPMPDLNCTVGEALEKVGEMVKVLKTIRNVLVIVCGEQAPYIKIALKKIDKALTLKDGRRIGRQE